MFGDDKNLRDTDAKPIKDNVSMAVPYNKTDINSDSYPKLNKLITALYIVTDIIEKDEPIRLKLRTLGVEILSDINSTSRTEINKKTQSILSFLDIASAINLISPMNFNILKKEFTLLGESLEATKESNQINHIWLEEFLKPKEQFIEKGIKPPQTTQNIPNLKHTNTDENPSFILKKQRQDEIIKAIKMNGGSATIAEVKTIASDTLSAFSEKTLQRELVAMSKAGILSKTGEKRWSKYSLNNS